MPDKVILKSRSHPEAIKESWRKRKQIETDRKNKKMEVFGLFFRGDILDPLAFFISELAAINFSRGLTHEWSVKRVMIAWSKEMEAS
jgi:hypothetical protein